MGSGSTALSSTISSDSGSTIQLSIYNNNMVAPKSEALKASISPSLSDILERVVLEDHIMSMFKAIKHPMPDALLKAFIVAASDVKSHLSAFYAEKKYDIFLELKKNSEYADCDMESLKDEIQRVFELKHISSTPFHQGDFSPQHNGRRISVYEKWIQEAATKLPLWYHVDSGTMMSWLRGVIKVKNEPKEQYLTFHYRKRLYEKCMSNKNWFLKNLQVLNPVVYDAVFNQVSAWYDEEVQAMFEAVEEYNKNKKKNTQS